MRYVIGVGANLGVAHETVRRELAELPAAIGATSHVSSSLYATSPVGGPDQDEFVNAILIVESPLEPATVLGLLQQREQQAGRVRDVRWGPRTLDLDIIDVDGRVSDDPALTLPHPRAHLRGFVLIPWTEIDPEAVIPGHGSVSDSIAGLDPDQRVHLLPQDEGGR